MKENEFKVGEWITFIDIYDKNPKQIIKIENGIAYTKTNKCLIEQAIKWIPKNGEWCWFYTNKLVTGRIVSPVLKQYKKGDERMIMERLIRNGKFAIDDKHAFHKLELIEPFIGELPSVLKELNES